jgi:GT2 family glycosyltransferase
MAWQDTITVVTPTLIQRVEKGGLDKVAQGLSKQRVPYDWLVSVNTSGKTDFNQAMNRMIGQAKDGWIVSVQDFIEIPEGSLEQISRLKPAFYTFPVGKSVDMGIKWDWRVHKEGQIHWQEWEICFGAAPRDWLVNIGGFDERLDEAWGFDNVNVGLRAFLAGYPIECNPDIKAVADDHDSFMEHPLKERRDPKLHNERLNAFHRGEKVNDIHKYCVV